MTASLYPPSQEDASEPVTSASEFDDFIYVLSHDIRSSVRAALELPQWIEEDLEDAGVNIDQPLAEKFSLMHTHMRRLDQMLGDLLDYSRVGRMQSVQRVQLETVLEDVLHKAPLPETFTLVRDIQSEGPRMGPVDAERLIGALLSNAVKHHDREAGRIEMRAYDVPGICVLTVSDDGPGIAEEYRSSVFNPMTLLKSRDELEGSGMGLTIVRKVVHHYGGELRWCMAAGARGAALEMRLPAG